MKTSIAAAVLLLSSVTLRATPPCDAADRLLAEMHYAEAQKAYLAILKTDPSQQCARTGLGKIAAVHATVTQHVELSKTLSPFDKQAAAREMLAAQNLDPTVSTSSESKPAPPPDPFTQARALKNGHQFKQADAALAEVLKGNPKADVPKDLRFLLDPFAAARALSNARLDDEAAKELTTAVRTAPFDGIPGDLEYVAGSRTWSFARHHQIFAAVALLLALLIVRWLLRKFLQPRLHVEDLKDLTGVTVGAGASLYLQQQLIALVKQHATGVSFTTGPITEVSIPASISSAVPGALGWMSALLPFVSHIYWRRTLSLTGSLQPFIDEKGVGMTLVLSEKSAIVSTTTLWQNVFGTTPPVSPPAAPAALSPAPYFDLTEPAAIWLLFQLLQVKHRDGSDDLWKRIGTSDWKSYALNAAGIRARAAKTAVGVPPPIRRAEGFFVGAIKTDPSYSAARANLGGVLQELEKYDEAIQQLMFARREANLQGNITDDPVFYSASYRLASIRYGMGDKHSLEQALAELEKLKKVMYETRRSAASRSLGDRERIERYIRFAFPVVDVMRLGIEAELDVTPAAAVDVALTTYRLFPTADVQYNVACTYSILSDKTNGDAQRLIFVAYALKHLTFALHLKPALAKQAKKDRALAALRTRKPVEFAELLPRSEDEPPQQVGGAKPKEGGATPPPPMLVEPPHVTSPPVGNA